MCMYMFGGSNHTYVVIDVQMHTFVLSCKAPSSVRGHVKGYTSIKAYNPTLMLNYNLLYLS